MRDLETIRRSFLRRSRLFEGKSSWPFISGDTYRSLCPIKFDYLQENQSISELDGYNGRVFVSAGIASIFFDKVLEFPSLNLLQVDLLIHNGDLIPSFDEFRQISERFRHIYSVNWMDELPNVSPIPIGLENLSYMRNGVPRDFRIRHDVSKDITLLVSFSDSTNPEERLAARNEAKSIKGSFFVEPGTTPREYRNLVSRSKFVLSPPGNGADCHRTWEALYLGSVPIVKATSWPFHFLKLPVASVTRWNNLSQILDTFDRYESISVSQLNKLFLREHLNAK